MKSVGIALATYNGELYIKEQLQSLLNQTYNNIHIYIHDDGSTDRTVEIIKDFMRNHKNNCITLLDYPSCGGSVKNFISILRYITEDYIMYCDQDDVWIEDKISKSISAISELEKNGDIPVCIYTDLMGVDKNNLLLFESFYQYRKQIPERNSFHHLLAHNIASGNTMAFNRALVPYILQYDSNKIPFLFGHDGFTLMLARIHGEIKYVPEITVRYRQHDTNQLGGGQKKGSSVLRFISIYKNLFQHIKNHRYYIREIYNYVDLLLSIDDFPDKYKDILLEVHSIKNKMWIKRLYTFSKLGILNGKDLLFV